MGFEQRRLAKEIIGLKREVRASATTMQLAYSSIENGGKIVVRDSDGREVMDIGGNPDGSYGATPRIGPTPPQATAPLVTPTPSGLTIRWDGEYLDSLMAPDDFTRVEVHLSTDAGFSAEYQDTIVGTIETPRGTDVPVTKLSPLTTYYAAFVVRSTSGARGPVSPKTEATTLDHADGPGTGQALTKAEEARIKAEAAAAQVATATAAANAAETAAIAAQADATTALTAANGKSKVWYATVDPTAPDGSDGDTWYKRDGLAIVGAWEKRSGVWESRVLSDSVIDTLSAAKITTGILNAATTIYIGDVAQQHTEIGQGGLRVYRDNGEGDILPSVNIGGADADSIQIMDQATGATVAGLMEDGQVIAQQVTTNALEVGGVAVGNPYDRWDVMFTSARGFDSGFQMAAGQGPTTTGKQDVAELRYFSQANRWYKVNVVMNVMKQNPGLFRLQLRYSVDGSDPADYTGNVNQMYMGMFYQGFANMHLSCQGQGLLFSPDKDVRVVAFIENITGGGTINYYGDPRGRMWVEDIGPVVNGQEAWTSGAMRTTATSTPPQTANDSAKIVTKEYPATWSRTWRNGSARTDTTDMVQGNPGSSMNYAAVGFGTAPMNDTQGGTILNASIRLSSKGWWYNNGGTAVIGNHGSTNVPASFPGGNPTFNHAWTTKSGTKTIQLPSDWRQYIPTGAHRGYTLGYGVSTSSRGPYGRFGGANDPSPSLRPKLILTYRK